MAFNRRGRRPMPAGGARTGEGASQPRQMGGARFAPRGSAQFGQNQGAMPADFGTGGGGNVGGGTRQDPRYVQPQAGNTTFEGRKFGSGRMQDPRFAQGSKPMPAGMGRQQLSPKLHHDPRYVQPLGQMGGDFGGAGNEPRPDFGRKQDPRYAYGTDDGTTRMGRNMNNSGIHSEGAYAGRRPDGLPNTNLRMPGSGGSRVMSTPTAGNFMRPKQPRENRLQRGKFPLGNSKSEEMGY